MHQAIEEAYAAGWLGENIKGTPYTLKLHLHTSAGRYICGEETALINALEGKRATPRAKPPFPQVVGLFGRPTIVNNCETLCNLPSILKHGSHWYTQLTAGTDSGSKIYGISGKVKNAGLWELPMGTPAREIFQLAGGMQDGLTLRGWLPGGASSDFLMPEHLDSGILWLVHALPRRPALGGGNINPYRKRAWQSRRHGYVTTTVRFYVDR